jgi:hypothetical protein
MAEIERCSCGGKIGALILADNAMPVVAHNFDLRCPAPRSLVAQRVFGATPGLKPRLATSTAQTAPAGLLRRGFCFSVGAR